MQTEQNVLRAYGHYRRYDYRDERPELIIQIPVNSIKCGMFINGTGVGKGFKALVRSVEKNGIRTPICVSPAAGGGYELVTGKRRLAAAKKLGLEEIPAYVLDSPNDNELLLSVLRDGVRDMNYFDEADCYRNILEKRNLLQRELAALIGRSQSYIGNKLRLLGLSPAVRRLVIESRLSERHARELVRLGDERLQKMMISSIVENGFSVSDTVKLVDAMANKDRFLQKSFKSRIEEYERLTKYTLADKGEMLSDSDKLRHLILTVRDIVDIAKKSGLKISAGQKNGEKNIELVVRVLKEGQGFSVRSGIVDPSAVKKLPVQAGQTRLLTAAGAGEAESNGKEQKKAA